MPRQQSPGEYSAIFAHGPRAEFVPAVGVPASIPNGSPPTSVFTSSLFPADGYYDMSVGVTASQTGNLTVQRYIDDAGTIPLDAGQTVALVANTAEVLVVNDGKPFASFQVVISNTGGATSNLTKFGILMAAH